MRLSGRFIRYFVFTAVLLFSGNLLQANAFPVTHYDYHTPLNGYSSEVAGVGGLNLTNPFSSHTAHNNPALLAFRSTSSLSATFRYYYEDRMFREGERFPDVNSTAWNKRSFSYFGFDSENYGLSYAALVNISFDEHFSNGDSDEQRYLDYYLDAYRFSFAERSGMLALGFNLSLLTGRVVYLHESSGDGIQITEQFTDSRGLGYNVDFGAAVRSGNISYGLTVPNLFSKVYWRDNPNYSLQRRLHAGIQWGDGDSYLLSGISREFNFSSGSTYHIGFQQIIDVGMIRGEYNYVPLRLGVYTESFRSSDKIGYSVGSGYQYSFLQIDFSYINHNLDRDRYALLLTLSVGL